MFRRGRIVTHIYLSNAHQAKCTNCRAETRNLNSPAIIPLPSYKTAILTGVTNNFCTQLSICINY